ncbi:MAG TPA: hypothetical protein VHG92_15240 [Afifellaceae bacterium]|nr:hypothetical protein [Afifellaceae bacterium]
MIVELARAVWGYFAERLRRPIYLVFLAVAILLWAIGQFAIGDRSLEGLREANRQVIDSLEALSPVGIYTEFQASRDAAEAEAFRNAVESLRRAVDCDPMSNPSALIDPACRTAGTEPSIFDQLLAPFRAMYRSVTESVSALYDIVSAGGPLTMAVFVLTHGIAFLALTAGLGLVAAIFLTPVLATLLALVLQLLLLILTYALGAVLALLIGGAAIFGFGLWLVQMFRRADELESAHGQLGAFAARLRKRRSGEPSA